MFWIILNPSSVKK